MLVYLFMGLIGLPIQHICAVAMMTVHNGGNVWAAFLAVSVPFLIGDIVKCVMASVVSVALNKIKNVKKLIS